MTELQIQMVEVRLRHFVLYMATNSEEIGVAEVETRDVEKVNVPQKASSFRFFDQLVGTGKDGEKDVPVVSARFNWSKGRTFLGGQLFSREEVKGLNLKSWVTSNLLDSLDNNMPKIPVADRRVFLNRFGRWEDFRLGEDVLLTG